ncbi:hypothetical protein INR49_001850 [Caranx melampygus]|nr:hypothetical protein INR49_001850 [Caranx melampygus]
MTSNLSPVSSLKDEEKVIYVQPHYKESYRLAIYALLSGGREAYEEFIQAEQIGHLLSEDEILFILDNAELAALEDGDEAEVRRPAVDDLRASTYFPSESDEEVPELDMGWPEVVPEEGADTSISLLFHPPRQGMPTIKEVIRKQIQEARQEVIGVTMRGVVVYILLDDSQVGSFLTMSRRVGINILDFQSIRVRTVQGQQYQCQSGAKFHGGLEQKFILVDCQTVLYGTYSYTWAYEKINTSMVLVVTGQLACSYDEEFRRLYARSIVPVAMCRENLANHYMADSFGYNSDYASQLSLHQVHMKPTVMHGMRSAQDSWYNNAPVLTRGFSVQDRLHQIHSSDVGNLVRGHSYAGDLHKLHPTSRLRMGTKDPQVKTLRGDPRAQKQQLHQSRYGLDQNLIPFNSESSLNRWKIDTYLNESVMHLDRGFDVTSPIASPFSSQTGLNEQVHSRSRDIKSRMEEMRQRRLSLQDFNNLRQSQESLRSMYNPLERSVLMSSNRSLDMRQSLTDLQTNVQNGYNVDSAHQKVSESNKDGSKRETMQMYNRHEPHAAGSSVMKQNDPSLKHSHLHPSNLSSHLSRAMESLTEVPEEKEGSNSRINSLDSEATHHSGVKKPHREEPAAPKESSNLPADSQQQNQTRGSQVSVNSSESAASEGREKSVSNAAENTPKVINASAAEVKGGPQRSSERNRYSRGRIQ